MTSGIYKRTEEHRKKLSLTHLGKSWGKHTKESKKRMSLAHLRKKHSKKTKIKISEAHKGMLGEKSSNWKGDKVGKIALHIWIRNHKPKPQFCEFCNERKPYDVANIKNHQYTRNPNDYKWLCRSCHTKLDKGIK